MMTAIREKAQLMSASEIDRTLVRLAHEILEMDKRYGLPAQAAYSALMISWAVRDLPSLRCGRVPSA